MLIRFFIIMLGIVTIHLLFSLLYASTTDGESIFISNETGVDTAYCLQQSTTSVCKTLSYVLKNAPSLNNSEVALFGEQLINETLQLSHVENLTIRGDVKTFSTIKCFRFNNLGSGLMIVSAIRLRIFYIVFEACGTSHFSTIIINNQALKYYSAVYIINSTDIQFIETRFLRNTGRALSMHDVNGQVEISKSTFIENMVPPNDESVLFGGGSIYIEFSYCSPGTTRCNPETNNHNKNSKYLISGCAFEGNRASSKIATDITKIFSLRISPERYEEHAGHGGGIYIAMRGLSYNNSVNVGNCSFIFNSAVRGGAISAFFNNRASQNTLIINGCTFKENHASLNSGGALLLSTYNTGGDVINNSIYIQNTHFVSNSAVFGGAISLFASQTTSNQNNILSSTNCSFVHNSALAGGAVYLKTIGLGSIYDCSTASVVFCNCSFIKNEISTNTFNPETSKGILESGILQIHSLPVDLLTHVSFAENRGSAIFAILADIRILEYTEVKFVHNRARNGGAISLYHSSILELHPESQVFLYSNSASQFGGAIYSKALYEDGYLLPRRCFIQFHDIYYADKSNISLVYKNNSAKNGDFIFTDSIYPCVRQISAVLNTSFSVDQWKSYIQEGIKPFEIATSPASIDFTLPAHISPGQVIDINPTALDDLDQVIPSSFQVLLESEGDKVSTAPFISYDGRIQIYGEPGTKFNLTLQTQDIRHVSITKSSMLENCPLGFILVNRSTCVCSANIPDRRYAGISFCDSDSFYALLQAGYWVGCIEDNTIVTGLCPLGFCKSQKSLFVPIPRTCDDLINTSILCAEHRKGVLCGECKHGYSPYTHSDQVHCGKCPYGALGILAYFASEILPLSVFFVVVITVNFKVTSAFAQSFLLFTQILFILNHIASLRPLPDTSYTFIRIHTFIVGFFSMFFFHLDELSFCLWKGATWLDILMFRYVTTLFIIFFLASFIILVNHIFLRVKGDASCSCPAKFQRAIEKVDLVKGSVVHGIATFLILSYSQYTLTSFIIISSTTLLEEGEARKKSVVHLHPSMEYFGVEHLPYAIPAILVLVFLSLSPPLLLISYPLLWKIKAKLRHDVDAENDTTVWPIRKLLPVIDSFQGVFRDKCRMFAGLIFLWKFILLAIAIFTNGPMEFFFATEVALFVIFTIHTLAKPYKDHFANSIDRLMLANMAIIVALKWYISIPSLTDVSLSAIELLIFFQLLLMYIPLIALLVVCIYWLLRKLKVIPKCLKSKEKKNMNNEARETDADDIFFRRAAELNRLASGVTFTEVGIESEANN